MFDSPWIFFPHLPTLYLNGEKFSEKKPQSHNITFRLIVVTAGCLPPRLTFACFSQQDMANAFAQKHLRSIILNVSSRNKLYFATGDSNYYCYGSCVIIMTLLLSGEGAQREPTNR